VQATDDQFEDIQAQLANKWDTGRAAVPNVKSIYKINPPQQVVARFRQRCNDIGHVRLHGCGENPGNQQRRFHGTFLKCSFKGKPCSSSACSACCIIKSGFDISKLGSGSGNTGWFGPGHYSTSLPSTAVGYGTHNCLMVVRVAAGLAEKTSSKTTSGVSPGYNSRVVNKTTGVDELMVPEDDQMLPAYIIVLG